MTNGLDTIDLTNWLLEEHPLFRNVRNTLLDELSRHCSLDLDELVVLSRYQVRTVLLCLNRLHEQGRITAETPGRIRLVVPGSQPRETAPSRAAQPVLDAGLHSALEARYISLVKHREPPVLVWGQRRLTPQSAVERARYLSLWAKRPSGHAIFLGDDDLVSPLFARYAPSWKVTVVDIDKEVLRRAATNATELGAAVQTRHEDISQIPPSFASTFDLAIADPFPSGDGSFERMFWLYAKSLLRPGGCLVSTVGPSHKPVDYARGAIGALEMLGLTLVDLRADYGRYEVFDFEFTEFERAVLSRLGLTSSIAHTKSLFVAKLGKHARNDSMPADFDFSRWADSTLRHYLTRQAGVEEQRTLAFERGLSYESSPGADASDASGIHVAIAFPSPLRDAIEASSDAESLGHVLRTQLDGALGVSSTPEEREELVRLARDSRLGGAIKPEIGLAIRAIESWERWRLDD